MKNEKDLQNHENETACTGESSPEACNYVGLNVAMMQSVTDIRFLRQIHTLIHRHLLKREACGKEVRTCAPGYDGKIFALVSNATETQKESLYQLAVNYLGESAENPSENDKRQPGSSRKKDTESIPDGIYKRAILDLLDKAGENTLQRVYWLLEYLYVREP